jgi:uncharacterized protein with HEPN domain
VTGPASRDRFLVQEMQRHLDVLATTTAGGADGLSANATHRYALEHACELLAEAAKHTSNEFRALNPEVKWSALRALRTAVAHPYDAGASRVRLDLLWRFASDDVPKIRHQLARCKYPRT